MACMEYLQDIRRCQGSGSEAGMVFVYLQGLRGL